MPWPGTCGDPESPDFGRGENTYTSGFEGQWTEEPTTWDNAYFKELLEYDWAIADGPGGRNQWYPILKAESNETEVPDIIMLTTDIALLKVTRACAWAGLYAQGRSTTFLVNKANEHSAVPCMAQIYTKTVWPLLSLDRRLLHGLRGRNIFETEVFAVLENLNSIGY